MQILQKIRNKIKNFKFPSITIPKYRVVRVVDDTSKPKPLCTRWLIWNKHYKGYYVSPTDWNGYPQIGRQAYSMNWSLGKSYDIYHAESTARELQEPYNTTNNQFIPIEDINNNPNLYLYHSMTHIENPQDKILYRFRNASNVELHRLNIFSDVSGFNVVSQVPKQFIMKLTGETRPVEPPTPPIDWQEMPQPINVAPPTTPVTINGQNGSQMVGHSIPGVGFEPITQEI